MKNGILILLVLLSPLFGLCQLINVKVYNIQNFEHPLMKTDDAILLNKVTYLKAGNTDATFLFDLKENRFQRSVEGINEIYPIKKVKIMGDITEIDVDYGNGKIVNYLIKDDTEKIMFCRWVKDNKIRGWCDKNIEMKKEN